MSNTRVQAQVFQTFDGHTDAATFFEHIRERAFAGKAYSPETLDGTLPVPGDPVAADVHEDTLANNKKSYATLFSEISRSLTGSALIVKRQIDVAHHKSGFLLLNALKTSAGLSAQVTTDSKLSSFLESTMSSHKYHILQHWIEKFTADYLEIEALEETLSDSLKLAIFRKTITFPDARYSQYLVHTFTSRMKWDESFIYFKNVAELLFLTEQNGKHKSQSNHTQPSGAAMYAAPRQVKPSRKMNNSYANNNASYANNEATTPLFTPRANANVAITGSPQNFALRANTFFTKIFQQTKKPQQLIIDSGASHHMTPHKHNLINFNADQTGAQIQGINENTMQCLGTGDLPVQFVNNKNQIEKGIIRNVWYVPNIQHVLAQIIKQGHQVIFSGSPRIITSQSRSIPIQIHHGIYTIDNIPFSPPAQHPREITTSINSHHTAFVAYKNKEATSAPYVTTTKPATIDIISPTIHTFAQQTNQNSTKFSNLILNQFTRNNTAQQHPQRATRATSDDIATPTAVISTSSDVPSSSTPDTSNIFSIGNYLTLKQEDDELMSHTRRRIKSQQRTQSTHSNLDTIITASFNPAHISTVSSQHCVPIFSNEHSEELSSNCLQIVSLSHTSDIPHFSIRNTHTNKHTDSVASATRSSESQQLTRDTRATPNITSLTADTINTASFDASSSTFCIPIYGSKNNTHSTKFSNLILNQFTRNIPKTGGDPADHRGSHLIMAHYFNTEVILR